MHKKPHSVKAVTSPQPESAQEAPMLGMEHSFIVENAGLVLLSPFFKRYHKENGLLKKGRFRDSAAAARGAHLLQALISDVTTDTSPPQQALVLNQVLCGLSTSTPMLGGINFTEAELDLARTLLHSAIANWPKVNHVSIDGFRGSFLSRRGKLTRGEDRWTLTIEPHGYDVLLSLLPWNFSVIKPLWMPAPLYVEC